MSTKTMRRAAPRTVGQYFLTNPPEDEPCKATCYRVSGHGRQERVTTMCDYGHVVSMRYSEGLGGSRFASDLNDLPVHAPFVQLEP